MKFFRSLVLALVATPVVAFAQQDEERRAPPIEIPDFSNLDEYIYEPRSVLAFGFRYIGGAKTSFSGTGRIPSPEDPGAATGANGDPRKIGNFDIVKFHHQGISSLRPFNVYGPCNRISLWRNPVETRPERGYGLVCGCLEITTTGIPSFNFHNLARFHM